MNSTPMNDQELADALGISLARLHGTATPNPACGCHVCNPDAWWMVVCDTCGNKRCPHATDHRHACTHSNDPGQPGSVFGAMKPLPVKP